MARSCVYSLATLALLATAAALPAQADAPRESHPLAPSLPLLSDEEYGRLEQIINRFIDADVGKIKGPAAEQAKRALEALGPEAIPVLVEALNRTAELQESCPVVVIARKLTKLLNGSRDPQLLDFVRENAGAGVTIRRHMGTIQDLRTACLLRKGYVQRTGGVAAATARRKKYADRSTDDLIQSAGSERGEELKHILTELETRQGDKVIFTLGAAVAGYEKDVKKHAATLLLKHLSRQKADVLKSSLGSDRYEVRALAAYVVGVRSLPFGDELIGLLEDKKETVQQAARGALVRLSRGRDFGPRPGASASERTAAVQGWQSWWEGAKR